MALPAKTVVFGEIGLSGEVRPVSRTDVRLKEAGKLGFTGAFVPKIRTKGKENKPARESDLTVKALERLDDLVNLFENGAAAQRSARTAS